MREWLTLIWENSFKMKNLEVAALGWVPDYWSLT